MITAPHEMLPEMTAEDISRQQGIVALRRFLNSQVRARNIEHYETEAQPAYVAAHGRAPQSHEEVAAAFRLSPSYRTWSAMNRSAQELLWQAAGEPIQRNAEVLSAHYRRLVAEKLPQVGGGLSLNPGLSGLGLVADIDIHLQPGGYTLDRADDDVLAGALYEMGGRVYSVGQGIGAGDSKAGAVIRFLAERFPDLKPARILDIGCSAGAAACEYALHFPEAEVHAVDIGAGMLRYAHARALALGARVFFHQMDTAHLGFPDGHFDLVVSHNVMHEIDNDVRRAMMRESHRLLAAGGVALHQDVPYRFQDLDVPQQVEKSWDVEFNNEPFWVTYTTADVTGDLVAAGFAPQTVRDERIPKLRGPGAWYVAYGQRG
ncbi:class I SAM-dependent methyltransferase [Niveispirillum sp.]|uniref:class I SAM-dependent methyltransferase n=1 Tax=Niveispirillum sp. TaxID=1917217 RepID=UPI001B61D835|nr:class I SAM-dependent methyltransferase [Niveispirillum sp.]MBP7335592.1 class I SAM-dependent methyltransferase [Niveispirillum sp.]